MFFETAAAQQVLKFIGDEYDNINDDSKSLNDKIIFKAYSSVWFCKCIWKNCPALFLSMLMTEIHFISLIIVHVHAT